MCLRKSRYLKFRRARPQCVVLHTLVLMYSWYHAWGCALTCKTALAPTSDDRSDHEPTNQVVAFPGAVFFVSLCMLSAALEFFAIFQSLLLKAALEKVPKPKSQIFLNVRKLWECATPGRMLKNEEFAFRRRMFCLVGAPRKGRGGERVRSWKVHSA